MSEAQKRLISATKGGWTDEELAIFHTLYPTALQADLLAALPRHTLSAIYSLGTKSRLKRPRSMQQTGERNWKWKGGWKDPRTYADRVAKNPDAMRRTMKRHQTKRRAEMETNGLVGSVRGVSYDAILARDGYICWLCHRSVKYSDLSFDHVIPLSKGGPHSPENIRVSHWKCNYRKRAKILSEADLALLRI